MGRGRPKGGGPEGSGSADFFRPRTPGERPRQSMVPAMETPSQAVGGSVSLSPGETALMTAIEALHKKSDTIQLTVAQFEQKLEALTSLMSNLESRTSGMEQRLTTQEGSFQELKTTYSEDHARVQVLMKEQDRLERRLETAENKLRETHIRVLGVPSFEEEVNISDFVSDFLAKLLEIDVDKDPFFVTKAYRIPSRRPHAGDESAGTIMVVLSDVAERDFVLKMARQKKDLCYKGNKILLFPDVAPATQVRRLGMLSLRKHLVERGITAAVVYPAKLKIMQGDKMYLFTDLEAARSFVDKLKPCEGNRDQ